MSPFNLLRLADQQGFSANQRERGGTLQAVQNSPSHGTAEPDSKHEQYMLRKTQEDKAATRAQRPKPKLQVDEDGFTVKTYGTKKSRL